MDFVDTLEIYKGGTTYHYYLGTDNKEYFNLHGTCEVKDDILIVSTDNSSVGYIIDMDNKTLTRQDKSDWILVKE